jgi:hypothetical protein
MHIKPLKHNNVAAVAINIFFILFLFLILRYQINLLDYKEWPDESETIVTAKLIASGKKLYSEIHKTHGPLIYLPGILIEKISDFGVRTHRIFTLLLQLIALTSIYFSPLLDSQLIKKIYTVISASFILLFLPKFYGHTYIFQSMAGLFLVIILTQYTLPSLAHYNKVNTFRVYLGNMLLISLPFIGISYLPASILLFAASMKKGYLDKIYIASILSFSLNLLYLVTIGSLIGFYVFHIYFNAVVMPLFDLQDYPTTLYAVLINTIKSSTKNLAGVITLISLALLIANTFLKEKLFFWKPLIDWRSLFVAIGIVTLLIRGSDVHGLAYYFAVIPIPMLLYKNNKSWNSLSAISVIFLLSICLIKLSLIIPSDRGKLASKQIQLKTDFSKLVDSLTNKEDRIIAYSNQNYEYIASQRLPASGSFYYLPWVQKYNENPKFDIIVDGCKDIKSYQPKIMLIDKWNVWDKFSWNSYGECIQDILDKNYTQIKGKPYYLRNDIYIDALKNNKLNF